MQETAARAILAEIGSDMSRFGSAARLASWAGVCPGNNESAGKRRRGQTRKGNRYLRRVFIQCAWAARKAPTYLGRTCRRLEARLGGKKAAMAVAHKILVSVHASFVFNQMLTVQFLTPCPPQIVQNQTQREHFGP